MGPPDDAGQALGTPTPGDQTQGGLGQGEAGLGAGEAHVAGQGQLQAGAEGVAVDGGNDRAREVSDAVEGIAENVLAACPRQRRLRSRAGDIPAAAKDFALACEDDDADILVVAEGGRGRSQLLQHVAVDGVAPVGA